MSIRLITAHRSTFIRDVLRISGVARKIYVVGEARSATELVELCRSEQPDVVYAEDSFDDGSEIESVLVLLMATGTRVIVVCDDPSPERLTRILALGAHGYLRHDTTPEQVLDAVESVAGGAAVLGPAATATVLDQWRRLREPARGGVGGGVRAVADRPGARRARGHGRRAAGQVDRPPSRHGRQDGREPQDPHLRQARGAHPGPRRVAGHRPGSPDRPAAAGRPGLVAVDLGPQAG